MKYSYLLLSLIGTVVTLSAQDLELEELHDTVEIIRDQWGVNHIYASNEDDLFSLKDMQRPKTGCFNLRYGVDKRVDPQLKFLENGPSKEI